MSRKIDNQRVTRKFLEENFYYILDKYRNYEYIPQYVSENEYPIFVFWWQGKGNMPPIVKECYKNLHLRAGGCKIHFIDKYNFEKYVTLPGYILEKLKKKTLSITSFSDVLRFHLLDRFGGLWLDATVWISDDIQNHPEIIRSNFFSINSHDKNIDNIALGRWVAFIQGTNLIHNPLYSIGSEFFCEYLKQHDKFMDYFLIDCTIDFIYDHIPFVKKEIDSLPNLDFNVNFFSTRWNDLCEIKLFQDQLNKGWLHKLTWKKRWDSGRNSYINALLLTRPKNNSYGAVCKWAQKETIEKCDGIVSVMKEWCGEACARIDIKNQGMAENDFIIKSENEGCDICKAEWMSRDGSGHGYVVTGQENPVRLRLSCIGNGVCKLVLRGIDRRDFNDKRVPIWVDYTSVVINEEELLVDSIPCWHDKPHILFFKIEDGAILDVEIWWRMHGYSNQEILDILSSALTTIYP